MRAVKKLADIFYSDLNDTLNFYVRCSIQMLRNKLKIDLKPNVMDINVTSKENSIERAGGNRETQANNNYDFDCEA